MILLLLAIQDGSPTLTLTEVRVREGATPEIVLDMSTTLPRKSTLTIDAGTAAYRYEYAADRLVWQPPSPDRSLRRIVSVERGDGILRGVRLELARAGVYTVLVSFEKARQASPDRIKAALREHFQDRALAERDVSVGLDGTVFEELADDNRRFRRALDDARDVVDRLVKVADEGGEDWERRALSALDELAKIEDRLSDRVEHTLLQASNQYLIEILGVVRLSSELIRAFLHDRKKKEAAGETVEEPGEWSPGEDSGNTHRDLEEGPGSPPNPIGGGRLSFRGMKAQIDRGDAVRARETLLWGIRFASIGVASARDAEPALRDARTHARGLGDLLALSTSDPAFEPYDRMDGERIRLYELPSMIEAYLDLRGDPESPVAESEEARLEIERLLAAYEKAIAGEPVR